MSVATIDEKVRRNSQVVCRITCSPKDNTNAFPEWVSEQAVVYVIRLSKREALMHKGTH